MPPPLPPQALRHEARVYFGLGEDCRHLALLTDVIPAATGADSALLVMEWAAGGTVHDWLRREPGAPLHARLRLVIQACRGLRELHERGMVHQVRPLVDPHYGHRALHPMFLEPLSAAPPWRCVCRI